MRIKTPLISIIFIIIMCTIAFGVNAETADNSRVVSFGSAEELQEIISTDDPGIVRFESSSEASLDISSRISIKRDNLVIDLNGGTVNSSVNYVFSIQASDVSITNGTINNGGIRVVGDDGSGSLKNLTINNAPEHGIYVNSGGSIGDIVGNTISNPTGIGIRLYSKSKCGSIVSNDISETGDHAIQLIGDSSSSTNDGCVAGDIIYNTITDCSGHGISIYQGSHCGRISYNKLSNIGGAHSKEGDYGIAISSRCQFESYAEEITHNEIDTVTSAGISVYSGPDSDTSGKWQDNGHINGDIAYNMVRNAPSKNTANRTRASIYVDNHARVYGDIHDNVVENSFYDGISVISHSYVHSIYSNTVTKAKICGLAVKDSSVVSGGIYKNTVNSAGEQGLMINNKSDVRGTIYKNTISKPGVNGIFVTNGAKANIIRNNTISKAGTYGIIAGKRGKITQVSKNTIVMNNAKAGMGILCNSPKCLISKISGNKITGKYHTGIRIKSPAGKVIIKANILKTSSPNGRRSTGISCEKAKKLNITGNKITGNKTAPGIYMVKCKGTVKSNTIKRCSKKIAK